MPSCYTFRTDWSSIIFRSRISPAPITTAVPTFAPVQPIQSVQRGLLLLPAAAIAAVRRSRMNATTPIDYPTSRQSGQPHRLYAGCGGQYNQRADSHSQPRQSARRASLTSTTRSGASRANRGETDHEQNCLHAARRDRRQRSGAGFSRQSVRVRCPRTHHRHH